MFDFNRSTENDMNSLDDLLAGIDSVTREFVCLLGSKSGHPVFVLNLPAIDAVETTSVYNDPNDDDETAQRELSEAHANGLAAYVLHAAAVAGLKDRERRKLSVSAEYKHLVDLMGPQEVFALAPWTGNLRGVDRNDPNALRFEPLAKINGVNVVKVWLRTTADWSLLDGQHRRAGFDRARVFLDYIATTSTYPSGKGKRSYFGLKGGVPEVHRQFWSDVREALLRMTVDRRAKRTLLAG